jgi:uncharacterized protein
MLKKSPKGDYHYPYAHINYTKKGVKALTELAEQGEAKAAYSLSLYYEHVRKDRAVGDFWERRAAELGHANAQRSLGFLMHDYSTDEKQREEGIMWLKASASGGNTSAKEKLEDINRSERNKP